MALKSRKGQKCPFLFIRLFKAYLGSQRPLTHIPCEDSQFFWSMLFSGAGLHAATAKPSAATSATLDTILLIDDFIIFSFEVCSHSTLLFIIKGEYIK